jgi:hypothetical protein
VSATMRQERTQRAARRKRGRVKTLASDGLQPLVNPAEKHSGIRKADETVDVHRERQQRLTPRQEEAVSWVNSEWRTPQEIVDRTGEGQGVVRNLLRVLATKGLIERDHETGRVRRVQGHPDPEST